MFHGIADQGVHADDLRTDVEEQGQDPAPESRACEKTQAMFALRFFVAGVSVFRACLVDVGQSGVFHKQCKQRKENHNQDVGNQAFMGQAVQHGFADAGIQHGVFQFLHDFVRCFQRHGSESDRSQHSGELVADTHDADSPGGCFRRTQDSRVRVGCCLQQGEAGSHQEQAGQEE